MVDITDPFKRDWVLPNIAVSEVWGVGKRLTRIEPIKEAVATYTQRAAEKLRVKSEG